jgi:hypothetical protein
LKNKKAKNPTATFRPTDIHCKENNFSGKRGRERNDQGLKNFFLIGSKIEFKVHQVNCSYILFFWGNSRRENRVFCPT